MIFCVEDDKDIRELIVYTLQSTGFDARGFVDGAQLFRALEAPLPRLILLDIMLPGEDGIAILKKLKSGAATKNIPVIMATAKTTEYDKVSGLELGADDYIAKPFGMMEMVARVKAVLRRCEPKAEQETLCHGVLQLNSIKRTVHINNSPVDLTLKEFELLQILMGNNGAVFTRDQLMDQVWGYEYSGDSRTVDVHIRTLRAKLGEAAKYIQTVRGVGYRFGD